jgi:hypothetical protein
MSVLLFSRRSGVEFKLFRITDLDEWFYEYEIFGRVQRGKLSNRLTQDDATIQVGVIIEDDIRSQRERPK